ncbi:MAG: LysR family transcriptional regulator [Lachnospiraceae bacterium]|nr:LysR family transcriptional regulator [Lachnospiraceae bacterium]
MTDRDMQYVLTIATYGNLTRAAEVLYLSQPALSIQLNRLEKSLGMKLFERTGKKMVLTYAGEEFVTSARQIMMKKFELEDHMNDIRQHRTGRLRIGYSVKQMSALFPNVFITFQKMYPQIKVIPIDGHVNDLEELLAKNELDILFAHHVMEKPHFLYETIYRDRLLAVLPKKHPACSKAVPMPGRSYPWLDLKEVQEECFILQHSNQNIRQFEEDAMLYADVSPKISYKISSIDAGIRMADAGFGVAFTLESYLKDSKNAEQMQIFSVGDKNLTIAFSAIKNAERTETAEMRKWIELTIKEAKESHTLLTE